MRQFIPAQQLNRDFHDAVVAPILASHYPGLPYSAGLIGYGSDVLGYDDARSTDHEWGPRLLLFLADDAPADLPSAIAETLRHILPPTFQGYSVHFGAPDRHGARVMAEWRGGPVEHKVEVHRLREWFAGRLGSDLLVQPSPVTWLLTPGQRLLEITAGAVYHDGLEELEEIRTRLDWYPRDVWLYLMAAQWQRISQLEAFVGRTAEVGDALGSTLVTATMVRDLLRLCFLIERRYPPYAKWLGTAFTRLRCGPKLQPVLDASLAARSYPEREAALVRAYEAVGELHNALGMTETVPARVSPFHDRPFQVLHAERFAGALLATISDPDLLAIPGRFGGIDQISDNTDLLEYPDAVRRLRGLYVP